MSEKGHSGEYHRADPVYRRQMMIFLALTVVFGVFVLVALHLWLRQLGAAAYQGDLFTYEIWLNRLLAGLCLLLGTAAAGFAQWMFRVAAASKAERRWPPSSMRTSADVRIRYLTSADSLISQLRGGAFALTILALLLCAWAIILLWTS
jgi:hypothetical protein